MLDEKDKRSPASEDILGKIDVIGDDVSKDKKQQQQSLNVAGGAAVAIMSESDVSDAEKIASMQSGPSTSNGGNGTGGDVSDDVINGDDDDDDEDDVIAPMSDSIRYVEISETGEDDVQRHHQRHHHHHHHHQGRHGSQGRTLSQPKSQKSYGSVSRYSKSLVMPSGHDEEEEEEDIGREFAGAAGSGSLVLMDRVGTANDDEKVSLLK